MTLIEILQRLRNGSYHLGEVLEYEDIRFEITFDQRLVVSWGPETMDMGKLLISPSTPIDNPLLK